VQAGRNREQQGKSHPGGTVGTGGSRCGSGGTPLGDAVPTGQQTTERLSMLGYGIGVAALEVVPTP
jgi:hypothetical protein